MKSKITGANITEALVRRYLAGMNIKVADAREVPQLAGSLVFVPTADDWAFGVKDDPLHCAGARCARRNLALPVGLVPEFGVVFFKTVAYVTLPYPREASGYICVRYKITTKSHRAWDEGKPCDTKVVTLKPFAQKSTLEHHRYRSRLYRACGKKRSGPLKKRTSRVIARGGLYHHHTTEVT